MASVNEASVMINGVQLTAAESSSEACAERSRRSRRFGAATPRR